MRRNLLPLCAGIVSTFPRYVPLMVTLTYRPGCEWDPKHVADYVQRVRVWARRLGIELPYVWVAEIQEERQRASGESAAAVVHYHVLWFLPRGYMMPKADRRGWWSHGHTRTEKAYRPVGYLSKYASKGGAGSFPRGLRLFGRGGLGVALRGFARWWCLPLYARAEFLPSDCPRRGFGGVYSRERDLLVRGPYVMCKRHVVGGCELWLVPRYPFTQAEVDEMCKRNVERSCDNARRAGYSWVSV